MSEVRLVNEEEYIITNQKLKLEGPCSVIPPSVKSWHNTTLKIIFTIIALFIDLSCFHAKNLEGLVDLIGYVCASSLTHPHNIIYLAR